MADGFLKLSDATLSAHYNALFKQVLKEYEEDLYFITQEDFNAWSEITHQDLKNEQAFFKLKNKDLEMVDALMRLSGGLIKVGTTYINASFDNFNGFALTKVFEVIQANKQDFESFYGIDEVIAKCTKPHAFNDLKSLNHR